MIKTECCEQGNRVLVIVRDRKFQVRFFVFKIRALRKRLQTLIDAILGFVADFLWFIDINRESANRALVIVL